MLSLPTLYRSTLQLIGLNREVNPTTTFSLLREQIHPAIRNQPDSALDNDLIGRDPIDLVRCRRGRKRSSPNYPGQRKEFAESWKAPEEVVLKPLNRTETESGTSSNTPEQRLKRAYRVVQGRRKRFREPGTTRETTEHQLFIPIVPLLLRKREIPVEHLPLFSHTPGIGRMAIACQMLPRWAFRMPFRSRRVGFTMRQYL